MSTVNDTIENDFKEISLPSNDRFSPKKIIFSSITTKLAFSLIVGFTFPSLIMFLWSWRFNMMFIDLIEKNIITYSMGCSGLSAAIYKIIQSEPILQK